MTYPTPVAAPEVTMAWRRSSFCADSNCVEVAQVGDDFALRDSKAVELAPMRFSAGDWAKFLDFVAVEFAGH